MAIGIDSNLNFSSVPSQNSKIFCYTAWQCVTQKSILFINLLRSLGPKYWHLHGRKIARRALVIKWFYCKPRKSLDQISVLARHITKNLILVIGKKLSVKYVVAIFNSQNANMKYKQYNYNSWYRIQNCIHKNNLSSFLTAQSCIYYAPPYRRGIKQWCCLTSVCRVHRA